MIYKPFFRDDLGYKPRYTQPLHLEEVVVSPIYSESEDYEEDLGYKPIYHIDMEGDESESTLSYTFASKEDFKSTMLPIYEKVLSEKGINPIFAKSLVAQDGLESAWGSKPSGDNNFGGIKGKGKILITREVENGKDVYKDQEFRNFASLEDYAKYKVNLLDGKKYKAFDGGLEDFSRRVSAGGYATDPRYKEVLDMVIMSVKKGGILKLQQAGKIDRVNGDYIHQFPMLWNILTDEGVSGVTGNTLDYIAAMPKVDAEVLTPILLRLEDYLSRNNKRSLDDLTFNEKNNLINLSSNFNKLDSSKGFTNGLDDDFHYLQELISSVSNDELDSLLKMDLTPNTIKDGFRLLKNKPKSIKLSDIKKVSNIFNKKYNAGLDTGLIGLKRGGILKAQRGVLVNNYNTPGDWYDYSGSSEIPKNGDHWGSRNPDTGLLLKHPNHETYYEMLKAEQRLGNRLFTDLNGREYSFNDFEAMTKGRMPGMKEKFYPSDLWSRDANKLYGSKLDTAVRYYNKLKALGAEDVQAAAIIGVLMKESSLDHHAVSSKGAKGVAQLLGDKYNDYTQWLSKNKKSDTAENQIEWVWDHMASGKDHWHDYYISLYNHSLNGFSDLYGKEKDTAIKDWSKMKDSKWAEYNYEAFRDDFYNMTDPGDAAELFTWTFERPGDDEADIDMRRRYSDSLYEYMTRFYKE